MKQCATRSGCQHGNGIGLVIGAVVGAFEWVDGDVDLRSTGVADHRTKFFPDVEHRRFISLTFSYGHATVKWHRIKGSPHRFNSRVVGGVFIAFTTPSGTGDGRLVNGFEKMVCQVCGDAHESLETRESHQYNGSQSLEFLDHFEVGDSCNGVLTLFVLFQGFHHVKSAQKAGCYACQRFHLDTCFVVG
jgi:hypothetical protein